MYVQSIYRFLYHKTLDTTTTEDLLQETFTKALDRIDSFHGTTLAAFKSWLFTLAYHVFIDHTRTHRDHHELDPDLDMSTPTEYAGDIDARDTLKKVFSHLETLSTREKDLFVMRVWDDLSFKEIAQITGKSLDATKKAFSRTLASIKANVPIALFFLSISFLLSYEILR